MFTRYRVRSKSEMIDYIFTFIATIANKPVPINQIRFLSGDGKQEYWFIKEDFGLSAWVVDINDTTVSGESIIYPWQAKSTIGLKATYLKDFQRKEIDWDTTNSARAELIPPINEAYRDSLIGATNTKAYKDAYDVWHSSLLDVENLFCYSDVWRRTRGTNVFHVGGLLKFDKVPFNGLPYLTLDCHYDDGTFSFQLYSNKMPYVTRHLIIGEYSGNDSLVSKSYIFSSSFIMRSNTKNIGYKDAFYLPAVVSDDTDKEAPIPSAELSYDLDNYLFKMVRCNVDYDNQVKRDSVNGIDVSFAVDIDLGTYKIPTYIDSNPDVDGSDYSDNTTKIFKWEYRRLHTSYENSENNIGVNYWSLTDSEIREYGVYDDLSETVKRYPIVRRSGTCGNSVNTKNNVSEIMPIMFYVLRDPDDVNSWSCLGHTDSIGYVNMYNMGTGRYLQSYYDADYREYFCYDMWKKRAPATPYKNCTNDGKYKYNDSYGVGGLFGIAVKDTHNLDFDSISRRWVSGE